MFVDRFLLEESFISVDLLYAPKNLFISFSFKEFQHFFTDDDDDDDDESNVWLIKMLISVIC
jgi:hypothetical protein